MSNNLTKDRSLKRFSMRIMRRRLKKKNNNARQSNELSIKYIDPTLSSTIRHHLRPIIPKNAVPKGAFLSGSEVEDIPKNSSRPINLVTRIFQKIFQNPQHDPTFISIESIQSKDRAEHG